MIPRLSGLGVNVGEMPVDVFRWLRCDLWPLGGGGRPQRRSSKRPRVTSPDGSLIASVNGLFLVIDAAHAGLRVLSGVDRKDRRMFALERVGRSGVRGSVGPHARERPHPRSDPAGRISRTGLG